MKSRQRRSVHDNLDEVFSPLIPPTSATHDDSGSERRRWSARQQQQQQQEIIDIFEPSRGILEPRPDEEISSMTNIGGVMPVVVGIGEVIDGARW